MTAPIYVVVASDDLSGKWRVQELMRDPTRIPNPIVCGSSVGEATLERATAHAAWLEQQGYSACRVGRVVFDDEPAFIPPGVAQ